MILYLSVKTDLNDLIIDSIKVVLATGETVTLTWDESDIERLKNAFTTRYKGVYFDEEYTNGKLDRLRDMQIESIEFNTDQESFFNFSIDAIIFNDGGECYTPGHLLPYVVYSEAYAEMKEKDRIVRSLKAF